MPHSSDQPGNASPILSQFTGMLEAEGPRVPKYLAYLAYHDKSVKR